MDNEFYLKYITTLLSKRLPHIYFSVSRDEIYSSFSKKYFFDFGKLRFESIKIYEKIIDYIILQKFLNENKKIRSIYLGLEPNANSIYLIINYNLN